jgi:hypothetical protein
MRLAMVRQRAVEDDRHKNIIAVLKVVVKT